MSARKSDKSLRHEFDANGASRGADGGPDLHAGELYINRELSWLEFNRRVLEEAEDPTNHLLERVKFQAIVSTNADEFFMIRVAGVKRQVKAGVNDSGADRLTPVEQHARISAVAHELVKRQYRLWCEELQPALGRHGIEILSAKHLRKTDKAFLEKTFLEDIFPVLTPLAIDPGHPFPHLFNLTLSLAVQLERGEQLLLAVVPVPKVLPRLVPLPAQGRRRRFVFLEDLITQHIGMLFHGLPVVSVTPFRVTRDSDLEIAEDEAEDLLTTIEEELAEREWGSAVRLEVAAKVPEELTRFLSEALDLTPADVYHCEGPLDLACLWQILDLAGFEHLKDPTYHPVVPPELRQDEDVFAAIRRQDILLYHPYESFTPVIDFIEKAAADPKVLAIKQTLYRTGGKDSPIIRALQHAAENGKQVTALVELKARFDEANNIVWAKALEDEGVHVVYGLIGLKTHSKITLIVRKEADGLRRYVHLSTGNYNATTARVYTDLGLLTSRPELGEDATYLFNLLTGYSVESDYNRFITAPLELEKRTIELIDREAENARAGKPARIIAQLNSLIEPKVIRALYRASRAGVEIDLIIRGICGLRPGIPGVSERIRVRSIVGRYLEHSRIYFFEAGGAKDVYLASADWMDRNFRRRVELAFPVDDPRLKSRILDHILPTLLMDNVKARVLQSDGNYVRVAPGPDGKRIDAQKVFMQQAREKSRESKRKRGLGKAAIDLRVRPSPHKREVKPDS